jgi:hypothetical protein
MDDYRMPPRPKGSTTRELTVIAEAHRVACQASFTRMVRPIRDAVELIVELLEERAKARSLGQTWDDAIEDG